MSLKKVSYAKYYATVLYGNWTKKKESYAQHGEDILVHSLLGRVESFVDIGANDGVLFSNTFKFAKMGARGLCVEPSRRTMPKLYLNHLFHLKVRCIHGAVSSRSGHLFLKEGGYESTLSQVHSEPSKDSTKVRAYTLDELFRKHPRFRKIDLLSIDVEGHEESVLQGIDKPIQAKVIILETDKSDIESLRKLPALHDHLPTYTNGINLILTPKGHELPQLKEIPSEFSLC